LNVQVLGDPEPGTPAEDIRIVKRDTTEWDLDEFALAWITLVEGLYHTSVGIGQFELWQYPTPQTFDAVFITASDVADVGISASAYNPASQQTISFRSQEGGNMRLTFLETSITSAAGYESPPYTNAQLEALRLWVLSGSNPILARDTSQPIAAIRWSKGQNEAVFKRRYRP
jgi:hypothetical protein